MLLGVGIAKHWNQLITSLPNIYVASIHLSLLRWMAQQMNIPGRRYRDFVSLHCLSLLLLPVGTIQASFLVLIAFCGFAKFTRLCLAIVLCFLFIHILESWWNIQSFELVMMLNWNLENGSSFSFSLYSPMDSQQFCFSQLETRALTL